MALSNVTQAWHAGKKMPEHKLITVLTAVPGNQVAKVYKVSNNGSFEEQERTFPKRHTYRIFKVDNIRDMYKLLKKLENKKEDRSYIVHGLPKKTIKPGEEFFRQKKYFTSHNTVWMILDFDSIAPPSWTPETAVTTTFAQVWDIVSSMPGMSKEVPRSVWHLSNSWGDVDNKFPKMHVFMQLTNPVDVGRLKSWAAYCKDSLDFGVDQAIYQLTQPVYTARPKLIGGSKANELNEIKRLYLHDKGPKIITSDVVMNLPGARESQIPMEREGDSAIFDYVIETLKEAGLVHKVRENGEKYDVECPLIAEHSGVTNKTSTTLMAPGKGFGPGFKCHHTNSHEDGKNGWPWFLATMIEQGILDQAAIHKIGQNVAKEEFDKVEELSHRSTWTIDKIQQNYIYVLNTGNFYSIADNVMINAGNFNLAHPHVWASSKDQYSSEKIKPIIGAKAFMLSNTKHAGGKIVAAELWDPSTTSLVTSKMGIKYLNTWRGFAMKPVKGNVKPFIRHMSIICPELAEAEALTDFIAHMIQRPWERPTWAPVHVSTIPGLGRGLLNSFIGKLVGVYFKKASPKEMFDSPYNEYLHNALWIGVEETSTASARGVSAQLKELITDNTANINIKYGSKLSQYPLYARLFFMTNELNALPIEEGDRRFWVCGPHDIGTKPKSELYYKKFFSWINNKENQAAVLHYLLNKDISQFSPHTVPFDTRLKEIMVASARSELQRFIEFIKNSSELPDITYNKIFMIWAERWEQANGCQIKPDELSRELMAMPNISKNPTSVPGGTHRFKSITGKRMTPEQARKQWKQYQAVDDKDREWL